MRRNAAAASKESRAHLSASKKGVFKVKRFLAKALAVVMLVGVCPMAVVNAEERGTVKSYVVDDAKAGTLVFDFKRGVKMSEKRKGTKLWAYASNNTMYGNGEWNTNEVFTSGASDNEYMGFVYKLDGKLQSVKVNTFGYGAFEPYVPIRTDIGYLIDDTVTFGDRNGDGAFTWDNPYLQGFGTEGGIVGNAQAPIKLNENVWTKVSTDDCTYTYEANDAYIETSAIPSNAKYMVVLLRLGTLEDGTEKLADSTYRYRGVTFTYESSIVKSELNDENKAVITLDSNAENVSWTVKKNGKVITDAQTAYDSDTFTYTIDGGFTAGDKVEISSYCGSFIAVVPGGLGDVDYDDIYFNTDKTYYIVGNTGKIDLITEKDGEKKYDLLPTEYTSSNEDVLSIDNKGNFTAKAAGEAVITPSVTSLDLEFEPITIDVFEKAGEVRSYFTEDWDAGTLTVDYKRGVKMSEKRNGTKLWSYAASGPFYNAGEQGTLIGSGAKDEYMAFVYKLDGDVESLQVHTWGYGNIEGYTPDRTDIGYLTDDTVTFGDRNGDGAFTWSHPDLQWWATEGGTVGNAQAPIKLNENIWTKVSADDCIYKYDADKSAYITTSALPAGAKYVVVLLKEGTLEDGTAPLTAQFYRYKGITINYKNALVGKELNNDGKVVLTMNADVSNIDWTVKVNGSVIENPEISYDKNTFTYYIGGFSAGDSVEVSSEYGSFAAVISDGRAQITSIVLKNADGEAVDEMLVDDTEYTVDMTVVKGDGAKAYAALYDKNGKLVKCIGTAVEGDAAGIKLDGITISEGYTLKVFCWNNMTPYAIYNDSVTNTFNTADF